MTSQTCWKPGLEFIACELARACQKDGRLDMFAELSRGGDIVANACVADFALQEIPQEQLELVREDCTKEGYLVPTIEFILLDLNHPGTDGDVLLSGGKHETTSFKALRDKYGLILPFPIGVLPKNETYNERFSALGAQVKLKTSDKDRCRTICRILAKTEESYRKPFIKDETFSTIGTISHFIGQGEGKNAAGLQLAHTHSLKKLGIEPVPRSVYCEIPVEYEYQGVVVKGKPDAVCRMGDILVIIDRKRAMTPSGMPPKGAHERQLGGYALGVEQMLGREFAGYVLIKAGRPFPSYDIKHTVVGQQRMLSYNITLMTKDSPMLGIIQDEEIVEGTHNQKELLANPGKWVETKQYLEAKGTCSNCWDKALCDDFTGKLVNGEKLPLIPKVRL